MSTIFNTPLTDSHDLHPEIAEIADIIRGLEEAQRLGKTIDIKDCTIKSNSEQLAYYMERIALLLGNPNVTSKTDLMAFLRECEAKLAEAQKLWVTVQGKSENKKQEKKAAPKVGG